MAIRHWPQAKPLLPHLREAWRCRIGQEYGNAHGKEPARTAQRQGRGKKQKKTFAARQALRRKQVREESRRNAIPEVLPAVAGADPNATPVPDRRSPGGSRRPSGPLTPARTEPARTGRGEARSFRT